MSTCPLCSSDAKSFYQANYYQCLHCELVFKGKESLLGTNEEKSRYENHENHILSDGYRRFLYNIIDELLSRVDKKSIGLDYGCGPYPMMEKLISEEGYEIFSYDPFFSPNEELLGKKYGFVTCCEVAEHFYLPKQEFSTLKNLLLPGGFLVIQTSLFSNEIDFGNWHYKNDPTHVSFYTKKSFEFIKSQYAFRSLDFKKNVIVLGA